MARKTGIPGVIEETAPPTVSVHVQPAAVSESIPGAQTVSGRAVKAVRSTMDLPPDKHADFKRWAIAAELEVGRSVKPQQVLRALVARLMVDERLAESIRQDLRTSGQ